MENYGYSYYLCHCVNSGMGGGGPGGGGGPRPECAPENPNRPPDCPLCPPEGCRSTTMLSNPTTTAINPTRKDDATLNHSALTGLSTEEISQFKTTGNYGARVEVLQGDSRV